MNSDFVFGKGPAPTRFFDDVGSLYVLNGDVRQGHGYRCLLTLSLCKTEDDTVAILGLLESREEDVGLVDLAKTRLPRGKRTVFPALDRLGDQRVSDGPAELCALSFAPIAVVSGERIPE